MPRQNYDNRRDQPSKQYARWDKTRKRWVVCQEANAQVTMCWSETLKKWVTVSVATATAPTHPNWYRVSQRHRD